VKNNRPGKAAELWYQILTQDPQNLGALINLGNLQFNGGNYNEARINYLNALELSNDKDPILRNLCILEYKSGNQSQAREYFNLMSNKNLLRDVNPTIYSDLLYIGE
jgi:tetratricopeptide (TPR) repeat protein